MMLTNQLTLTDESSMVACSREMCLYIRMSCLWVRMPTSSPLSFAGSPRGLGEGKKRDWTKNKLERLRRRSPGHNSAASHAKPAPNANMGNETTKRRLITFIGGLDLCNGRYDTPRHSLFHTLKTVHTADFYQGCIAGADIKKGGEHMQRHPYRQCRAAQDRLLR